MRNESADVLQALRVEPTRLHAAPDGEQVGLSLAGPHELVPAFVVVNVKLHLSGEALDLLSVEDEEAREGAAPANEIGIHHRRSLPASDRIAADLKRPVLNHSGVGARLFQI